MSASPTSEQIISIVTPSLNQGEFLGETIRSVLSQRGDFYIDYIINDGGSGDESRKIIQLYESRLNQNCDVVEKAGLSFYVPRIGGFEWNQCLGISYRWSSEKDEGQADAINRGMHAATGHVVAFINSDDVYRPGAFRRVLDANWYDMDFVYGKGMWISESGHELLNYPTFKPDKYSLYFQCTLCQPTVFFKKEAFNRLGDFSLNYDCAFDYEYWLRAVFQDYSFTFLNETLACSRMHIGNKSLQNKSLVKQEARKLKKTYYSGAEISIFRAGFWLKSLPVQMATIWRAIRLNHLLGKYR
jgi:glycosyltransferase involved in cell wall biosynthesis